MRLKYFLLVAIVSWPCKFFAQESFPFQNSTTPVIYIDTNDAKVVQTSAEAFVNDVELITGNKLQLKINREVKK